MLQRGSVTMRGVIAGLVAATVLALWFLIVDIVAGAPFRTPALLANSLLGRATAEPSMLLIIGYTIFHFGVFKMLGWSVAQLLARTGWRPHLAFGLVLGFLLFDVVFYAGVILTGTDVVNAIGWPAVLTGCLLAGVALFATLRALDPVPMTSWRESVATHPIAREGVIAGLIGAGAVALWFLLLDVMRGQLFFTPAALGSALLLGARGIDAVVINATTVGVYSLLHVVAFLAVGLTAALLMRRAEDEPRLLLGMALLFVTLEAFSIGLFAISAGWLLDTLSWWTVVVANLVAAVSMGGYLWQAHPALHGEIGRPLEEMA